MYLTLHSSPLDSLTGANATNATVSPLIEQITDIIGKAVDDVKALASAPIETILASVDGTVTVAVSDVAQLLAKVLSVSLSTTLAIPSHLTFNYPLARP